MENYRQSLAALSEQQRIELYRELRQRLGPGKSPVRELLVLYETDANSEPTAAMRRLAEAELAEYERPTRYLPITQLPLSPQGKLDRTALAALVPEAGRDTATTTLPELDKKKLVAVSQAFAESLARSSVAADDNFFELGGHSLLLVDCILGIEKRTGVRLSTDVFLQNPTPRALAAELENKTRLDTAYLYPVADAAGGLPVFIFSASRLAYALKQRPNHWRLFGVQLRWVDDQEQQVPYRDLQDLAGRICAELAEVVSDKPYVIAGSSFAGMLAFEVARQMHKAGKAPSLTVLIDPSPFSGVRTWLQNDLEADTDIGYAQRLLLVKWLLINNPLRARFWRRLKQRFGNSARPITHHQPVRASSAKQASSFNDARTFELWRGYRASSYGGRVALLTTSERVWQVEQNWRQHLSDGTSPILLQTTHKEILREPFMTSDVVPLLERAIEQAVG